MVSTQLKFDFEKWDHTLPAILIKDRVGLSFNRLMGDYRTVHMFSAEEWQITSFFHLTKPFQKSMKIHIPFNKEE